MINNEIDETATMVDTKPQILIVDDEPSARKTLEMFLLQEAYELHFATSGPEAFVELEEIDADVILLDVMMPGMDGFEVCQLLKKNPKWQQIPVIMVTALDSKEDLKRGLEYGADDFLHKPVNRLELQARVRSMLRIKKRHDELQATLQLRESLSNMIVHDIRNPLATIAIFCDLLQGKVDEKGLDDLKTIRDETNRLNSFVNDMLMMAKMDKGQLVLNRTEINLNELARKVHTNFEPMAQVKQIDFQLDLPVEELILFADKNLLHRVFDNLISNALKFSPRHETVKLQVRVSHENGRHPANTNQVKIMVTDQGPGVAPEDRERIFDQFQIVMAKRKDIKQVGLGLAFCRMIVEAHNGRIYVTDNHPKGSVFVAEWPY